MINNQITNKMAFKMVLTEKKYWCGPPPVVGSNRWVALPLCCVGAVATPINK